MLIITGLATTGSHPIDGRNFPIVFLNGSGISDRYIYIYIYIYILVVFVLFLFVLMLLPLYLFRSGGKPYSGTTYSAYSGKHKPL